MKHHRLYLYKKYGMNSFEYHQMLKSQQESCAICGLKEEDKNLAVDHNHETNEVRGLLCFQCNSALGLFKENLESLKNAIAYLESGGHPSRFYIKTNRYSSDN